MLNLPHIEAAVKHYYSQKWMALEDYLALRNGCSGAQWHLTFLVKLAVVAA